MKTEERWRDIPGFKYYQASNLSRFRTLAKTTNYINGRVRTYEPKILKPYQTVGGYLVLKIKRNNKWAVQFCHRLVALAWIPNPENKPQINHINGIKSDNQIKNLEWGTQAENLAHAMRTGLLKNKGEDHKLHKLSERQVIEIRKTTGMAARKIAEKYNVCLNTIQKVLSRKTWTHI